MCVTQSSVSVISRFSDFNEEIFIAVTCEQTNLKLVVYDVTLTNLEVATIECRCFIHVLQQSTRSTDEYICCINTSLFLRDVLPSNDKTS